ncbi:hypothetical protein DOT_4685 [Desulfosporosinus sp. OT]|nr:hypothetical protein DOT_4685 [Desulfosporosinus sp. OT]
MKKRAWRIIAGSPLTVGEGNFQKPAAWVLIISVLAVILLSVCRLTNPTLNPVLKLELPDATSVLSMEMEKINEGTSVGRTTVKDSEDIKTVLSALSGARKTLTQSVNDYPTQENYLVVRLVLEREKKTLYLYTQGNGYYVEEPYIGVYKYQSDSETNAAIHKIYNDRLSAATPSLAPLTLDDVRELARKGDNLVFGDFKDFKGADFSSNFNYRIMGYGVEGGYRLIVRTDCKQIDSANLESIWESGGSGIDIRYSDVDEFIKGHPSSEALTSDEARAVAESTSSGHKNIKKGTPREMVLKIMGEPNFKLSGLYGDGYVLEDGSTVVFYYGANELVYDIKRSDEPGKPIGNADFNRDGLKESIYLDQSQRDNGFVTLRIDDSSGKDIWSEQAGWHIHHKGGHILLCTEGRGWYQAWGEEPQELHPGDVVKIPPEVKHWHGAAKDSWFAHLAVEIPAEGVSYSRTRITGRGAGSAPNRYV